MAESSLSWDHSALVAEVNRACVGKLRTIGGRLVNVMADNIGVQGPPRSDEGDFPRMDTQALRDSLEVVVDAASLSVRAGSPLGYAVDLEFGRAGRHPMAPRPWLGPSFRSLVPEIQKIMGS